MQGLTNVAKQVLPPFLITFIRKCMPYGWKGNYSSWSEAQKYSTGYSSDNILERVKEATLMVKNGEAKFERDSVIFNEEKYSYPLLSSLLWSASQYKGRLYLLDFGGSLGSTYFQNKRFLDTLEQVEWSIVEQCNFIKCGQQYIATDVLKFYYSIEECFTDSTRHTPEIILLSSILQYLEEPYEFLKKISNYNFKYIIFDRTAFINGNKDRITIQKVPAKIYNASYPAWFFNREKFEQFWNDKGYSVFNKWDNDDAMNTGVQSGYLLVKNEIEHS